MAEKKTTSAKKTAAKKSVAKKATAKKTAVKKAVSIEKKAAKKTTVAKKASTEKNALFAVIESGGKQYIVREGDTVTLEKLPGEHKEGSVITFSEVLLVDDGKSTKVGTPHVSGASVKGAFVEEGRSKKVSVIRFRSKSRYFKNRGHRQPYTKVKITHIA